MKAFWQYVALAVAGAALIASIYYGLAASRFVVPTGRQFGRSTAVFFTRKAPHDFTGIGYRLYTRHVAALAIAVSAMLVGAIIGRV